MAAPDFGLVSVNINTYETVCPACTSVPDFVETSYPLRDIACIMASTVIVDVFPSALNLGIISEPSRCLVISALTATSFAVLVCTPSILFNFNAIRTFLAALATQTPSLIRKAFILETSPFGTTNVFMLPSLLTLTENAVKLDLSGVSLYLALIKARAIFACFSVSIAVGTPIIATFPIPFFMVAVPFFSNIWLSLLSPHETIVTIGAIAADITPNPNNNFFISLFSKIFNSII